MNYDSKYKNKLIDILNILFLKIQTKSEVVNCNLVNSNFYQLLN